MDNARVAEVLETAADLYKAEKVEWCTQHWIKPGEQGRADGGKFAPKPLTMCAEGALLLAAGFNWKDIRWAQDAVDDGSIDYLAQKDSDKWLLYRAAARAVIDTMSCGCCGYNLYSWNDETGRVKQDVIDAFDVTAKDLRNQGD